MDKSWINHRQKILFMDQSNALLVC